MVVIDAGKFHNHGCHGGSSVRSFKYVMHHTGIESEQSYPYKAKVYYMHIHALHELRLFIRTLYKGTEMQV